MSEYEPAPLLKREPPPMPMESLQAMPMESLPVGNGGSDGRDSIGILYAADQFRGLHYIIIKAF